MPVCIAGMHRSGGSLITRALYDCGLDLGRPDDLLGPSIQNREGFWENRRFRDLNEDLLRALGGGWDYPPAPGGWEGDAVQELAAQAVALLDEFAYHEPWGWKDPRNCLTLPFWLSF